MGLTGPERVERKDGPPGTGSADELRRRFQELVSGEPTPESLIAAWRQFVVWDESGSSGPGSSFRPLNYGLMVEAIAGGDCVYNPVRRTALLTDFEVRTTGFNG